MSQVMNTVANTAFSLTLSGNSGISPFLTMAIIGVAGKIFPDNLPLEPTMEKIMASWPAIIVWCSAAILEFVGKCVPVIDQIMDAAMAFVVPFISTLGTFSAFGSFDSNTTNEQQQQQSNNGRKLKGRTLESNSTIASGISTFVRVILVFIGAILALSIHFCKMLIRLLGEGCLTWLITIIEVTTVFFSVLLSIFIRQFAIFIAVVFVCAAVYNGKKRYDKRKEEQEEEQQRQQLQQVTSIEDGVPPESVVANFSRTSDEIEIEKVGTTTL